MSSNPLLARHVTAPYSEVHAEHVVPAITQILEDNLRQLAGFLPAQLVAPTFSGLMQPLEDMQQRLLSVEQVIYRLASEGDAAVAAQYLACAERLQAYELALQQNNTLQGALLRLQETTAASLDRTQTAALDLALRNARLAGVGFQSDVHRQHLQIDRQLDLLYRQYNHNLTQAQTTWTRHIIDVSTLAGASPAILATLAENARRRGLQGWLLTLDWPLVQALLQQLHPRRLREDLYQAWYSQASAAPDDNGWVAQQILKRRAELAALSGHAHYASRAMATRMFDSHEDVARMLNDLITRVRPAALEEMAELVDMAELVGAPPLQPWDLDYYREKYRQAYYGVADLKLREYFPLAQVLKGLCSLTQRVFHVELSPRSEMATWHEDVLVYEVTEHGQSLGHIYIDVLKRPGKRPGAWMEALRDRHRYAEGHLQLPAALLSCEFIKGTAELPTLLGVTELKSLLHEFGHALQHVLTRVEHGSVAGSKGLADDAVELISTLFEQWALQPDSLALFAGHYLSGAPLPSVELQSALAAEDQFSAMVLLVQLQYALLDYRLHAERGEFEPGVLARQVLTPNEVLATPDYVQHVQLFTHLFTTDQYAGGYYTYVWSQVMAAHLFQRFKREGVLSAEAGLALRDLLMAPGGTMPMLDLIEAFAQSRPDHEALLENLGIAAG